MSTTLMRCPEVLDLVPLSKSTLYLMIQQGSFPAPVKLGRRAVAWRLADVEAWIKCRADGKEWV